MISLETTKAVLPPLLAILSGSWTLQLMGDTTAQTATTAQPMVMVGRSRHGRATQGEALLHHLPRAEALALAAFRTPSPASSAFGRKKTPTINEDDGHASLIHPSADDYDYNQNGNGMSSFARKESFSLSNENANVPVIERVIALFDFEAQEEGDLGFSKGQVIAVTRKTNSTDDWWEGRVEAGMSASKTAIFPENYTAPL